MENISSQDIRKLILAFLQQRLENTDKYKNECINLEKAKQLNDQLAINEIEAKIVEIKNKFKFENWMEDAFTRRIFWISFSHMISKGIHPSSNGTNIALSSQIQCPNQPHVSSSTLKNLPLDCTGNPVALDIFALLNSQLSNGISLMQLIHLDHTALLAALSDDEVKGSLYLANIKKAIYNDFNAATNLTLNKQIYWPNSQENYLSPQENNYRLLIPLFPSALSHLVYQKIQTRFSEQNKQAKEIYLKYIKDKKKYKITDELQPYFFFHDLAIVKIGGTNPQNISQLISKQGGSNYLLSSIPPSLTHQTIPSIKINDETIFNSKLQSYVNGGFSDLMKVVKAPKSTLEYRNLRKDAMTIILMQLFRFARHYRTKMAAGWSKNYNLKMAQKIWLDPERINLIEDVDNNVFKAEYEKGNWYEELATQFATWINNFLKQQFPNKEQEFGDSEIIEWQREFNQALKASQRKQQGIF